MAEEKLTDQELARRNKLPKYVEMGVNPFGQRFQVTASSKDINEKYKDKNHEELEECKDEYVLAGRIMLLRKMGKASFFNISDKFGKMQCYISLNNVGEENYALFKLADVGDIVGVKGTPMKTQTGEMTIKVEHFTHLTKALKPLPEKFHGLTDVEERYRKRHLDLIMNQESRRIAFLRPKIIREIQNFLDKQGFVEVETSILQPILGGAAARPFITHYNALNRDFYLRIATELALKKLIVGGMERVYEIGRQFRNEGVDTTHNPEFTSMELYQAYGDLSDMIQLTEDLIRYLAIECTGGTKIHWLGHDIDVGPEFKKASMCDLINEKIGVDFYKVNSTQEALELAKKYDVPVENHFKFGHIVNAFFEKFVEDSLIQPTIVYGHPLDITPLARKNDKDPRFTERFELYIATKEFCNAYTELNDPIDQKERFIQQVKEKEQGNEEANEIDYNFLDALEYGLPPTGGIGFGIDRLVMFLAGVDSIREVLLFPAMKTINKDEQSQFKTQQVNQVVEQVKEEPIDFSNVEIEPLFTDSVDFETFSKSDFRAVKVKACEAVNKSKKLLKFTLDDGTGTDRIILSGIHSYYEPEQLVGKTLIAIVNLPPRAMMGIESCGMLLSAVNKQNGEEKLHLLMVDDHIPAGAKLY